MRSKRIRPRLSAAQALAVVFGLSTALATTTRPADPSPPVRAVASAQGSGAFYFPLVLRSHNRTIEPLGQIGGFPSAVAWAEPYAYVGVGPRLVVLDVGDPANMKKVGESAPAPGYMWDIEVHDGFAYALYHPPPRQPAFRPGIRIYDVHDARRPQLVGEYSPGDWSPGAMAVDGRRLLVVESDASPAPGVRILDASHPALPRQVGIIPRQALPSVAVDLVATARYVYVVSALRGSQPDDSRGLLSAVDIHDVARPMIVAAVRMRSDGPIVRLGRHLFVMDQAAGLTVVDIADPPGMRVVSAPNKDALGIAAVVSGSIRTLAARPDGFLFAFCQCRLSTHAGDKVSDKLIAIDARDPEQPGKAVDLDAPVRASNLQVAVSNRSALFVNEAAGSLYLADVADPHLPPDWEHHRLPSTLAAYYLAASATTLYVRGWANGALSLFALDVARSEDPRVAWTSPQVKSWSDTLAASGNALYLVHEDGLHVFDTRPKADMVETARIPARGEPWGVAGAGDRLYMPEASDGPARPGGLRVFDVATDPLHPREIGSTPGSFTRVAVAGPLAWVAADVTPPPTPNGEPERIQDLQVLDVSDPSHIELLASFAYPMAQNEIAAIAAAGDEAFVAQGGQLFRHRLSADRTRIALVTVMDDVQGAIAIHEDTLFAHFRKQLTAFDIRSSPHLAVRGTYTPRGGPFPPADDMVVAADRLYVAASTMGVWIFDADDFVRAP